MARSAAALIRRSPLLSLSVASFVATVLMGALLHRFFWKHAGPIGFDDGYTMALGERLIDGQWLPYVDGCSHRGPLLYWAAGLAQLVTGRFGWKGTRVLSMVTTYGSLLGVFGLGVAVRKPVAAALGAVFFAWVVFGVFAASPSFCITGEGVASPFAVASLLAVTIGIYRALTPRSRNRWFAVGGACAALAGLAKQTALPIFLPLGVWILADAWRRSKSSRECWIDFRSFLAAFSAILSVVVLRYAASGALGTFWYWYYEYNADIYMLPYRNTKLLDVLGVFVNENQWVVGCFFFSSLVSLARPGPGKAWSATPLARSSTTGLERTAASIAVVMFFAGVAPLRFWPHYFLCVFPFVALTVGLRAEDLLAGRAIGRTSAWAALLMLLLANSFLGAAVERRYGQFTNEARRGGWQSENREAVCGAIDAYSTANDSLFIWGFSGDLYLTCRRHPASRFTYLTLVAGIVPPNWSIVRDDEVAKNAREQLIEDLRKNRPSVVLDSPESMGKVSFEQIPMVREFIKHDYCLRDEKSTLHDGKVKIWVRRDLPACAQAPLADSI